VDVTGTSGALASCPDHAPAGRAGAGEKLVNERGRQLRRPLRSEVRNLAYDVKL
jgi:hypothetical protein